MKSAGRILENNENSLLKYSDEVIRTSNPSLIPLDYYIGNVIPYFFHFLT